MTRIGDSPSENGTWSTRTVGINMVGKINNVQRIKQYMIIFRLHSRLYELS